MDRKEYQYMKKDSLKKFDMRNSVKTSSNIAIIGQRNTGKSVLMSERLYFLKKNNVPRAFSFSGTVDDNKSYFKFIPDTCIFDSSDIENKLAMIVDSQKDLCMMKRKDMIPKHSDLRVVIILDDLCGHKSLMKSEILKQLFMNGRIYDISIILSVQHVMQMAPCIRANCDVVMCLKESSRSAKEQLYKTFFSIFPSKNMFLSALDVMTKDFGCLVLNNKSRSCRVPSDMINWYKAKTTRNICLCLNT